MQQPKIALVHNWLTIRGGSEKVLFELHKLYPDAPIYTLVYKPDTFPELTNADIRTSWLQNIPWLRYHHELFPPIRYFVWRFTKIKGYDVVLTNCSSENKAARVIDGIHIAYIHTPPHYYWRYFHEYLQNPGFGRLDPLARIFLRLLNPLLRRLDKKAAQNPDIIYGNSSFICEKIKTYYDREAKVLHPPVDTERFARVNHNYKAPYDSYFLCFGRQTVFKKFDLIISVFKDDTKNLVVVGDGPEHDRLKSLASGSANITFLSGVNDQNLAALVSKAEACIFANEEDFGITWVESMAAGVPVITYGSGGALDTVIDGTTGVFFGEQTSEAVMIALHKFKATSFDKAMIKKHARNFSNEVFAKNVQNVISDAVQK